MAFAQIKYTGSTPGTDSSTYVLFSTVGLPERYFAQAGATKFVLDLKHSHLGTLNAYKSDDRGTNWRQVASDTIAAPGSTGVTHAEYLVGAARDWKLEWANGGTAQSPWTIDMCLADSPLEAPAVDVIKYTSLGAATTANVKAGTARLFGFTANNRNAAVRYFQLFDSTGGTGTVLYQWPVPVASASVSGLTIGTDFFGPGGWPFATGLTWGMSTTAGSYVAATASETDVSLSYR